MMSAMEEEVKYHIIQADLGRELSHAVCVSNMAYNLGKRLGLDQEFCYKLAVAGMLHDIGKLEMVKNVYSRSGEPPLRVEEMRFIRTHPALSYAILNEYGYPEEIAKWVLYHHENYDGSGYPANKSGEEIPLGARILRVCDVFAALTANRHYRKAYSIETAMELMIGEVKNFDMKIFLTFMDMVHSMGTALLDRQDFEILEIEKI